MEPLDLVKKRQELEDLIKRQEAERAKGKGGETKKAPTKVVPSIPVPATPQKQLDLISQEIIRPELNIARFASFIFISPYSKKVWEKRTKTWRTYIGDDNEEMIASLTIEPLKDHKTPTTTTYKYFLALIQIWEEQGRPGNGKITFSSRDIARVLGLKWSGSVSEQLERELDILDSSKFTWEWAFLDTNREHKALVRRMNILVDAAFYKQSLRRKKEKFTPLHSVTFHEFIVQNLLAGVTKPLNYHTIISIGDEGAVALYTHLDIVMANRAIWSRNALNLIEDLQLTGERYKSKRTRKAKLESWIKTLNNKPLSNGKLSLSLAETVNGDDWKLIARRIPKKTKNRFPKSPANPPELRQELLNDIDSVVGGLDTHKGLYELFVAFYDVSLIHQALSEYKADIQTPRNPRAVFTAILHRIAHVHGKEWINQESCGKGCKYRPENQLF